MKVKNTRYLWVVPMAGLLALTACSTTKESSTMEHSTKTADTAPAPAAPASAGTSSYLVTLHTTAPSLVTIGDQFAYSLAVTAKEDVNGTTVVDTLPAGAALVSSEPAATQAGDKLTWNLGEVNRGETKTIKVTLKAEKEGALAHCATVSAVPRVCLTTVVGRPQIAIKKTGPEMAMLGQDVAYTIVVQNTGNATARNVVVTDAIPDGLSSASGQQQLTFNVGDLAPGASKSVPVPLKANKRGKFTNKATATSSLGGKAEAEATTTVVQSGLKIEKTAKDKEIYVNRAATYDIIVSNTGDTELSGVVVTDTAAAETIIAAAEGATVTGTTATWNVGTLSAGQKKSLSVKILSKVSGRYSDTASVTTTQGLKDSATDSTLWKGVTGVLVEFLDNPDPIQTGETSQFTIRVTNQGTSEDIRSLNIVATLPAELEVVPGTVSAEGVVNGKTITWPAIPSVAPKASVTRTYVAKALKVGDARSKASITTSMRPQPIEQIESTTVY